MISDSNYAHLLLLTIIGVQALYVLSISSLDSLIHWEGSRKVLWILYVYKFKNWKN